jgi:hypothetical protein
MKPSKRISSVPDFKFRAKKTKITQPENEFFHPRIEVKSKSSFGEEGCNALLAIMYSQENEILFI